MKVGGLTAFPCKVSSAEVKFLVNFARRWKLVDGCLNISGSRISVQ